MFLAGPYIQCAFYGGGNISESGSPDDQKAERCCRRSRRANYSSPMAFRSPTSAATWPAVKTRAHLEDGGDTVVINGAKRWCTGADWADYIFCFVNSDPERPEISQSVDSIGPDRRARHHAASN